MSGRTKADDFSPKEYALLYMQIPGQIIIFPKPGKDQGNQVL